MDEKANFWQNTKKKSKIFEKHRRQLKNNKKCQKKNQKEKEKKNKKTETRKKIENRTDPVLMLSPTPQGYSKLEPE